MMQPLLRRPGVRDDRRWRFPLARPQGVAHERMVAVVPRGFDQDAPEVGVAGLRDCAAVRVSSRWSAPRESARQRPSDSARGELRWRIAALGGNRQGGQVIHPTKASETLDARGAAAPDSSTAREASSSTREPRHGFVDRAQIGPMRLRRAPERPRLRAEPPLDGASTRPSSSP